ncbi:hypothetical protein VOLCADRAFT_94615 [Volvox carteri f. nagariensis]|uniref:Pherophorin domain-containing protein n=1 Tax=Volvox carteri f. nagariensis TaxID=3068 RepID=D8U597_VOLCA|nr:uncharacterized protein VOLCADRAFT_94615 [Volvox carteri f. nagariensis]EFJ45175.1 hypothetical protein VOLCADRAFT_94615 [Volvox carteri f. nagariensis]|eukprot:XP_002953851.1 hypothetical protein VOLCADRAFT_94615 [Volvox carteri f. nagariensis]
MPTQFLVTRQSTSINWSGEVDSNRTRATIAKAQAEAPQSSLALTFPYSECKKAPSAYRLEQFVSSKANNTYCFAIRVDRPANCSDACCSSKLIVKKLVVNVKPECDVPGVLLAATLNGKPTSILPTFDKGREAGVTLLRLTHLDLSLDAANGAEICITLNTNRAKKGCINLEQLCVPPPNEIRPGTQCSAVTTIVAEAMASAAAMFGDNITSDFTLMSCSGGNITFCGTLVHTSNPTIPPSAFNTEAAALLSKLLSAALIPHGCPPYLYNHIIHAELTANLPGIGLTRLAEATETCTELMYAMHMGALRFPNSSRCDARQGSAPFAAGYLYSSRPGLGRRSNRTTLYCFTFTSLSSVIDGARCGNATILQKVDFWANEELRRSFVGFGVRPSNSGSLVFRSPSWGPPGSNIVKATQLRWTLQQAAGAEICLELLNSVSLLDFCISPYTGACYLSIFDPSGACCPVYTAMEGFPAQ